MDVPCRGATTHCTRFRMRVDGACDVTHIHASPQSLKHRNRRLQLAAGRPTVFTGLVSIAGKAVSGAAWNLVAGVGSRVVALVGTLILTRFVAPNEYGEITAATVAIATAMTLTDACVGQSILARRVGPDFCFHG